MIYNTKFSSHSCSSLDSTIWTCEEMTYDLSTLDNTIHKYIYRHHSQPYHLKSYHLIPPVDSSSISEDNWHYPRNYYNFVLWNHPMKFHFVVERTIFQAALVGLLLEKMFSFT